MTKPTTFWIPGGHAFDRATGHGHRKKIDVNLRHGIAIGESVAGSAEIFIICEWNKSTNFTFENKIIWAISWDYDTFRPPLTHSSNAHEQPSSEARYMYLIFVRTLRLLSYFICANSEGSGETARLSRLAWAFAGRLCNKYHHLMSWLIWC